MLPEMKKAPAVSRRGIKCRSMTREQTSLMLAMLIKPFVLLVGLAFLVCVRYAIIKYMPDGWLKRLFLIRLDKAGRSRTQGRTTAT